MKLKKNNIKKIPILFILISLNFLVLSQDIKFAQFYAIKDFYNPGLSVNTKCDIWHFHTRYQFPEFNSGFKTITLNFSKFFARLNSGVNVFLQNDIHPNNIINVFNSSLAYIYQIKFSNKNQINLWLQTQVKYLHINVNKIIFPSNIDQVSGTTTYSNLSNLHTNYFIASENFGYLVNIKNFYFGNSFKYFATIDRPKQNVRKNIYTILGFSLDKDKNIYEIYVFNVNLFTTQLGALIGQKNFFIGGSIILTKYLPTAISFDLAYKKNKITYSFTYSLLLNKNLLSAYELSIIFRLKCKKYRSHIIFCPAYQL